MRKPGCTHPLRNAQGDAALADRKILLQLARDRLVTGYDEAAVEKLADIYEEMLAATPRHCPECDPEGGPS